MSGEKHGVLKLVLELGPLAVFFLVNSQAQNWNLGALSLFAGADPKDISILAATLSFMVATVIALSISLAAFRRIPVLPLISGVVVLVFGGLTLYLQNDVFIKMKPTIVNVLFGTVLLVGLYAFKRPLLGLVFGSVIALDEAGWAKLTARWGMFFFLLAILNEIVWRFFSTDTWVAFKVFGIMPLTLAFTFSQLPLMQRHALPEAELSDQK